VKPDQTGVVASSVFIWICSLDLCKGKKNKDLWLAYHTIAANFNISFTWVKGHNGHPENERCDVLAVKAATGNDLGIDREFEALSDLTDNSLGL
jgi:ribonuclease HI